MAVPGIRCLLVSSLVFTSACAFGNRNARLIYPPSDEETVKLSPATGARVAVQPVKDARPDPKNLVGYVRNGFHMHTADVVTSDDAAAWATGALRLELQRAGIDVVDPGPGVPELFADLSKVMCDAYMTYTGSVSLHVRIADAGQVRLDQVYLHEGGEGMNWAATADSYGLCVSHALQNVARRAASDAASALKRAPAQPSDQATAPGT